MKKICGVFVILMLSIQLAVASECESKLAKIVTPAVKSIYSIGNESQIIEIQETDAVFVDGKLKYPDDFIYPAKLYNIVSSVGTMAGPDGDITIFSPVGSIAVFENDCSIIDLKIAY